MERGGSGEGEVAGGGGGGSRRRKWETNRFGAGVAQLVERLTEKAKAQY